MRDYVQRGFYSTFEGFSDSNLEVTSRVERLVGRIYQDQDKKIQEFEDAFQNLRSDLDTGMLQQAVFVASRILDNTNTIGMSLTLLTISIENLTWRCSASEITEAILGGRSTSFVMLTGYQSSHYQRNN